MLDTQVITEIDLGLPQTFAFRINGEVQQDDMRQLAERMLHAFDEYDEMDLVFIFDRFEGSSTSASFDMTSLRAQVKSLANLRHYVVVGAPDSASGLIETMGHILPVEAKTFETEAEAREWLAKQPKLN